MEGNDDVEQGKKEGEGQEDAGMFPYLEQFHLPKTLMQDDTSQTALNFRKLILVFHQTLLQNG